MSQPWAPIWLRTASVFPANWGDSLTTLYSIAPGVDVEAGANAAGWNTMTIHTVAVMIAITAGSLRPLMRLLLFSSVMVRISGQSGRQDGSEAEREEQHGGHAPKQP